VKAGVIDLRRLPAPEIVEALSFEAIKRQMLEDFRSRYGEEVDLFESDPAVKLLEVSAYRELLLRARVNEAARATMPAFARGANLDHVATRRGIVRAGGETDESLLGRFLDEDDLLSAAGSKVGYIAQAKAVRLSGGGYIVDANADEVGPARVTVWVLFDPKAEERVRAADLATLREKMAYVRALTDHLTVEEASLKRFRLHSRLKVPYGADWGMVRAQAEASLRELFRTRFRVGQSIELSVLYAALHARNDVTSAEVIEPAGGVLCEAFEAPLLEESADGLRLEMSS
jgi:phage-related baseplate assembly protein